MRIDKTQGLGPQEMPDAARGASKSAKPSVALPEGDVDGAKVDLAASALLSEAAQTPEVNSAAVEEAKQLLKAGQLDTPDAFLRAAKSMLERGI